MVTLVSMMLVYSIAIPMVRLKCGYCRYGNTAVYDARLATFLRVVLLFIIIS